MHATKRRRVLARGVCTGQRAQRRQQRCGGGGRQPPKGGQDKAVGVRGAPRVPTDGSGHPARAECACEMSSCSPCPLVPPMCNIEPVNSNRVYRLTAWWGWGIRGGARSCARMGGKRGKGRLHMKRARGGCVQVPARVGAYLVDAAMTESIASHRYG